MQILSRVVKATLAMLLAVKAMGAPTQIRDTGYTAFGGTLFSGRITVTAPDMTTQDGRTVHRWEQSYTITSGAISVNLEPNDTAIPVGTSYVVIYRPKSGQAWSERWVVPTSETSMRVNQVRVLNAPVPAIMIQPQQIASGGATTGQALLWNGSKYAPGNVAAGGGGPATYEVWLKAVARSEGGGRSPVHFEGTATDQLTVLGRLTGLAIFDAGTDALVEVVMPQWYDGTAVSLRVNVIAGSVSTSSATFWASAKCLADGEGALGTTAVDGAAVTLPMSGTLFGSTTFPLVVPVSGCAAGSLLLMRIHRSGSDPYGARLYSLGAVLSITY